MSAARPPLRQTVPVARASGSPALFDGGCMAGEPTAVPSQRALDGADAGRDVVVLRLPADGAYLSVLRTATAGLASRLDFTLDDIEDLRIAVDEACAMLLPQAVPGADL